MSEAEKLARDCDESADIWANEIDTRRKAAALLRRQAEQIKELRRNLEVLERWIREAAEEDGSTFDWVAINVCAGDAARYVLAATKEET